MQVAPDLRQYIHIYIYILLTHCHTYISRSAHVLIQSRIARSLIAVSAAAPDTFGISVDGVFYCIWAVCVPCFGTVGMAFATELAAASGRGKEFLNPIVAYLVANGVTPNDNMDSVNV